MVSLTEMGTTGGVLIIQWGNSVGGEVISSLLDAMFEVPEEYPSKDVKQAATCTNVCTWTNIGLGIIDL